MHNSTKDLVLLCAKAAIDKKAEHSLIYDLSNLSSFSDFFLITSGSNERQVQAICDEISRQAREAGYSKPKFEGYDEGRWALVDFGSVIVHVFHDSIREFYRLEELWGHAPRINVPSEYYSKTPTPTSKANSATAQF